MEVTDPSCFGTATFGEPKSVEIACVGNPQRKIVVSCAHGEWRPPERLAKFLSDKFFVPIDCYTGADGLRRIVPQCNFEKLIDLGSFGGLAVLHDKNGFDDLAHSSYREMFLIHQHVRGREYLGTRGMKEHLTREFKYSRDLFIRPSGRLAQSERDVLPGDIGLTAQGKGYRPSVKQLLDRGRQVAQEAGHTSPISKFAIPFALAESGRMNPLDLDGNQVRDLIRQALFDCDAFENPPSVEVIEIVTERLSDALNAHHYDNQEEFDAWFSGPNNSLVKQIAQRKGQRGGRLKRGDVRQVLLHLGWQAYDYVGWCVSALMRTIKNSIPEPLNNKEQSLFEHMYESQPYYGNLPAALLAERMEFLRRAVLAIWDEPENPEHVGVLHRLLACYAEMARTRRAADRRSKQRSQLGVHASTQAATQLDQTGVGVGGMASTGSATDDGQSDEEGHTGGSAQFIENVHAPDPTAETPFEAVAEHIRQLHQIACSDGCMQWEYHVEGESKDSVMIVMHCVGMHVKRKIRMPRDEFIKLAEKLLGWKEKDPDDPSPGE